MDNETLFVKTRIIRLFFLAAIPGTISMLASALYQLIDGIFVGQFLGETAFAALNLAMPFVIINFSLADLIGVGSSVPISISLGQKHGEKANNIFTCACLMIVSAGVVIGGFLFFSAPFLIRLMGAQGEFERFAVQYLRVYALCSPVTTMVFAADNFLRICGKIRESMMLNIFMSVCICVLEFVFLFVFHWEIWAAALASCIGMALSAILALSPFIRGKMQLRFCRPKFSVRMVKQIVFCGTPNFLNNIAGRITSIIMNLVLVRFGGESAVSVYGILMYVEGFIQPLLYGMCDSLQPAVGYNWGAGQYGRVRGIERCCFISGAILSLTASAVIFVFPAEIASLFISETGTDLMETAAFAVKLFSLTYLTRWFSFTVQSYMLAVEKSGFASIISVSTALIFPVALIAILWPLGLTGLWLNFSGTALLAGVLAGIILILFRKQMRGLERI